MENEEFLRLCKAKVAEYTNSHMDKTDGKQITVQDVYVVWSCKTLQNSKALLSTTVPDGMYYELTYNGDKHELYFDAYKKFQKIQRHLLERNRREGNCSGSNRKQRETSDQRGCCRGSKRSKGSSQREGIGDPIISR